MSNFRDWAHVDTKEKSQWKKKVLTSLAFIGACTLGVAVLLLIKG
jgi:hypothetical protein